MGNILGRRCLGGANESCEEKVYCLNPEEYLAGKVTQVGGRRGGKGGIEAGDIVARFKVDEEEEELDGGRQR